MTDEPLAVFSNAFSGDGPLDTATSRAILAAVGRGDMGETFEIGATSRIVAFGKHDTTSPSFADAVQLAVDHGFQPTVRIAGGRAAVFHEMTLRFGWTRAVDDPAATMYDGFRQMSTMVTDTLATFGVHGVVGEIPGEYCPGSYSVHIAGRKVMGVGQRLIRNAAHVGGVVVVANSETINDVLIPIYRLLDLPLNPSVTGSVADALLITVQDFAEAFVSRVAQGRPTVEITLHDTVREEALRFRPDHDPSPSTTTSGHADTCAPNGNDQDSRS
ncbi:MAG: hypothetical protein M5U23_08030 [Acidimicrobiia bacterium]|nr:hypothetical protein [Acidimicrobiia bacterium]